MMMADMAQQKRTQFYLTVVGLLVCVAAVTAVSARDPSGVSFRIGMVLMTVGAASLLPKQGMAILATIAIWLIPNLARAYVQDVDLFNENMLLELVPLLGVAIFTGLARKNLDSLETESMIAGATPEGADLVDPATGVYDERLLRPALEMEVARGRRFSREFAFVLVGIDQMRQRFDYRDETAWEASFIATAKMLRGTRNHVDRVYRYGLSSFALVLPESGARDVQGLVRRLTRAARRSSPAEGEPGGPLPCHYGATFFPQAATTTEDLLRRAEVALRLAESNPTRVQIDGAEARELAAPETLRTPAPDMEVSMPAPAYEPSAEPAFAEQPAQAYETASAAPEMAPEPAVAASYEPALEPVAAYEQPQRLEPAAASYEAAPVQEPVYAPARPEPAAVPEPMVASVERQPEPVVAAPTAGAPESLDQRLAQLMKRMEETEELMRTLRKAG
jgi:diguanylate cyclase (GGDEF)-like protein